jgi:anti-sigma regulatory factor (Ser/Thr protein kinase)
MPMPAPRAHTLLTTGVTYPGIPEQISAVRADLRTLLDSCPMADDAILCASEMATNAVLHSQSRLPCGTFTVRGKISPGDYAWVKVEDNGGPWVPAACDPERGHGLDVIQALADDWGIDGDQHGRTVWVRFDWPST